MTRSRCSVCGGVLWREAADRLEFWDPANGCRACGLAFWTTQEVSDSAPYERAQLLGQRLGAFVSCRSPDVDREYAWEEWSTRRDEANAPCENVESWFRPGNARDTEGLAGMLRLSSMRAAAHEVWPPIVEPQGAEGKSK